MGNVLNRDYRVGRDWRQPYQHMGEALGVESTDGYVTHEAGEWHPGRELWYFFPRKVSSEPFDEERDKRERGGNTLVSAGKEFDAGRAGSTGLTGSRRGPASPDTYREMRAAEL